MTWEFKPGMKVVCVNDQDYTVRNGESCPSVGEVYTIRNFTNWDGVLAVRLEELINKEQTYRISYGILITECSFRVTRFRPLQSKGMDLLNSIVAGVNGGKLIVEDEKYMKRFKESQRKKVS